MEVRVEYFDTIDSTNAELMRRAKAGDVRAGDTVIANSQSAGRGRRGNSFSSPRGGIYFSFVAENSEGALATVKAGVAVARTLRSFGFEPEIKWVNDVLLGGKKVCGILAEAIANTSLCVIGVGINTRGDTIPPELRDSATALDEHGEVPERDGIIFRILREFDAVDRRGLIDEYKHFMTMLGGDVMLKGTGEVCRATDVSPLGELIVMRADGSLAKLNSGEVSVIKQYGRRTYGKV